MAIQVAWPSASDEPYEITTTAGSGDKAEKVPAGGEEFDRFKELAAKIVKVPKTEIDEKREKS